MRAVRRGSRAPARAGRRRASRAPPVRRRGRRRAAAPACGRSSPHRGRCRPRAGACSPNAWPKGISTASSTTSWLAEARMPRWSQVGSIVIPGASPGTRNQPIRTPSGSSSAVAAQTSSQRSPGAPVEKILRPEMAHAAAPSAIGHAPGSRGGHAAARGAPELGLDAQRVRQRRACERRLDERPADARGRSARGICEQGCVRQVHDQDERCRGVAAGEQRDGRGARAQVGLDAAERAAQRQVAEPGTPDGVDPLERERAVAVVLGSPQREQRRRLARGGQHGGAAAGA